MMLTDAGPIFAILDKGQLQLHQQCVKTYRQINSPLITTWPCFTEAMYLLSDLRGWSGARKLWELWDRKLLMIHESSATEQRRMKVLMEKYKDTPMD